MATTCDKDQELVRGEMKKVYSKTVVKHSMNPRNVEAYFLSKELK